MPNLYSVDGKWSMSLEGEKLVFVHEDGREIKVSGSEIIPGRGMEAIRQVFAARKGVYGEGDSRTVLNYPYPWYRPAWYVVRVLNRELKDISRDYSGFYLKAGRSVSLWDGVLRCRYTLSFHADKSSDCKQCVIITIQRSQLARTENILQFTTSVERIENYFAQS